MELNCLTIEATAASLNLFLQHYGTDTSLGTYLTASIENLQLELGVAGCPFNYDFKIWGELATDTWVKAIWERVWHFDLSLEIDYKTLEMPRERDECIMERLVKDGVRGSRLPSRHQQSAEGAGGAISFRHCQRGRYQDRQDLRRRLEVLIRGQAWATPVNS